MVCNQSKNFLSFLSRIIFANLDEYKHHEVQDKTVENVSICLLQGS